MAYLNQTKIKIVKDSTPSPRLIKQFTPKKMRTYTSSRNQIFTTDKKTNITSTIKIFPMLKESSLIQKKEYAMIKNHDNVEVSPMVLCHVTNDNEVRTK